MMGWPNEASAGIPPPPLVLAWLTLGLLATDRIPLWAAHWLVAGYDGDALAELAGLHRDDGQEIRDLLGRALAECGATEIDIRAAAATAFDAIAALQVAGRVRERWVVDMVAGIVHPDYEDSVIALPLGRLAGVDDEWDGGWGRDEETLREEVRQACAEQRSDSP